MPRSTVTTVLVADDDPDICDLLAFKLEQGGYDVRVAVDGLAALAEIAAGDVDVALLDVMMPGASGLEVCRQVRAAAATAHLPVIMVTARVGEEDVRNGFDLGADDYLVKPFSPRELMRRLEAILQRKARLAPVV
jgi:DNA-binding response OmpR family regulator